MVHSYLLCREVSLDSDYDPTEGNRNKRAKIVDGALISINDSDEDSITV